MSENEVKHVYDGIEEHDNRLPNWWLWTFWGACLFSLAYWGYFHLFEVGPSSWDLYQQEVQAAAETGPGEASDESLLAMVEDEDEVAKGRELFLGAGTCYTCHRQDGGGMPALGVNLTDAHWKNGPAPTQILGTIMEGVAGTSMIPWGKTLGPVKARQLTAYILTLKNTNVENGKEPEGKHEDEWAQQ